MHSRLSIAYFSGINFEANATALPGTVAPGKTAKYALISFGHYILNRLIEAYDPDQIKRT